MGRRRRQARRDMDLKPTHGVFDAPVGSQQLHKRLLLLRRLMTLFKSATSIAYQILSSKRLGKGCIVGRRSLADLISKLCDRLSPLDRQLKQDRHTRACLLYTFDAAYDIVLEHF